MSLRWTEARLIWMCRTDSGRKTTVAARGALCVLNARAFMVRFTVSTTPCLPACSTLNRSAPWPSGCA